LCEENNYLMKLRHSVQKGQRHGKRFLGIKTEAMLWHSKALKKWCNTSEIPENTDFSNHQDCRSVRAFRRILRRMPNELHGVKFTLVGTWVGIDVYGKVRTKM